MSMTIINLYGSYRGFLRISETDGGCTIVKRGVPDGARIFLITASASKPLEIEDNRNVLKINIRDIGGALAAHKIDGAWNIIMQGAINGRVRNMDAIKRVLWTDLNRPPEPKPEPEPEPQKEPRAGRGSQERRF